MVLLKLRICAIHGRGNGIRKSMNPKGFDGPRVAGSSPYLRAVEIF